MPLRAVLDTNLLLRGLLKGPLTAPLIDAFVENRFALVTTEIMLAELVDVFQRPRIQARVKAQEAKTLLDLIILRAEVVEPAADTPECRDPDDRAVLAAALGGRASFIVTSDGDLRADDHLRVRMRELGVELVGVAEFLERIRQGESSHKEGNL